MMLQVCAPSLELRQEMRMELRQEAQLRLEQRLEQVQEMKQQLTLQQYLTFLEPFKELFDWCEKNKSSLRRFNNFGFDFNYHQIPLEVARRAG